METESYPDNWTARRIRVYRRDNYECQNCGQRGGPYGDTELQLHHVIPTSDEDAYRVANLETLCYDCHNAVHEQHVPRQTDPHASEQPDCDGGDADSGDEQTDADTLSRDRRVPTVSELRNEYLNGEIDEETFEDDIEDALKEHGPPHDDARATSNGGGSPNTTVRFWHTLVVVVAAYGLMAAVPTGVTSLIFLGSLALPALYIGALLFVYGT